jgi:hypothetical protein
MEKADEKTALRVRKRQLRRYTEAARRELLARAKTLWAQGASMTAVAAELDVSKHTLSYWRAVEGISGKGKAKMQRVHVIAAQPVSRTIEATGPCGLRFELTLDDAAALLRKLR